MDSTPSLRLRAIILIAALIGFTLGAIATTTFDVFADGDAATDTVPRRIPYQGYLELDGRPLNAIGEAAIPMRFAIFDGPNAEVPVYTQALAVEVFAGRFTAIIGPTGDGGTPIADVVAGADDLYLGITLLGEPDTEEDDVTLANRQQILATPYAMWATSSTNLSVGNDVDIARNLSVGGQATVTGGLTVGGQATVTGGLTVAQGANVTGEVRATGAIRSDAEIIPSNGAGGNGINFPDDPGGGVGDDAWIRYFSESGENTRLQIGVDNDDDDDIEFYQNESWRMRIQNGVSVRDSLSVGGNLTVGGQLRVPLAGRTSNDDGVSFEFKRQESCAGQRGRIIVRRVGNDDDDAFCACLYGGERHGSLERWFCMEPE
ncbi:MAG: hypothetical protein CMH57_10905 [Myxococcales bacterium]|nr:hypothetical protein [Myxococcales bacterium]